MLMFELPLFPLNTVLFPGMPLKLHVFEERYKQMINWCIEKRQPFGVVLIKEGSEVEQPFSRMTEPYMVGCTAQITQVQPLPQGRMNIAAIGQERFQIFSLNYEQPYLVGNVELYPLKSDDPLEVLRGGRTLRGWLVRYLQILADAGKIRFDASQLPNDPLALAYLGAVLLEIPMPQKQKLLDINYATELIAELRAMYRREVALLNAMLTKVEDDERQSGPFSLS